MTGMSYIPGPVPAGFDMTEGRTAVIAAWRVVKICSCSRELEGTVVDNEAADPTGAEEVTGVEPVVEDTTEEAVELGRAMRKGKKTGVGQPREG